MGTISSAFSIMSGALDADQAALNVVANNVANANTPGYTEETPDWRENDPIDVNGVSIGQGSSKTGATSQRDSVLVQRLDQQQQLASASGSRLTALNSIQALFTPDSGSTSSEAGDIGSDLTKFFSSFSSLEANPTDNSLRENVLSTAGTLAGDISNAAASLNSQQSALDQEATGVVSQVNALTGAMAQLNQQIESTSPNADAGTLEDQRQQDLSQLSQLIGINQTATENNGLEVTTTSGQLLVSDNSSYQLTSGIVERSDAFLSGNHRRDGPVGLRRRGAGRRSDGARSGYSQRAVFARSTGLQRLHAGEYAEQCGNRSGWRQRERRRYLFRSNAGRRQRSHHERGDDRSQPDRRCGTGTTERATTPTPRQWPIWPTRRSWMDNPRPTSIRTL